MCIRDRYRIKSLGFCLLLDEARPRHDHGVDGARDMLTRDHLGGGAQILDPAIGAGADEHPVDVDIRDFLAALQPHVI